MAGMSMGALNLPSSPGAHDTGTLFSVREARREGSVLYVRLHILARHPLSCFRDIDQLDSIIPIPASEVRWMAGLMRHAPARWACFISLCSDLY